MSFSTASTDISLRLSHSIDEDGEYSAFTNVKADILLKGKKIGYIKATVIDRQRIPDGYFMSAMDGHSQNLQWIGSCLYEPRYGRTKLKSLGEFDDSEFDTMCIDTLHVDDEYKRNGASDVGATALHQFLRHPFIRGQSMPVDGSDCWKVSSAVYVLDPLASMTEAEKTEFTNKSREESVARAMGHGPQETDEDLQAKKEKDRRLKVLERQDANQFLRNGFFQDPAIASQEDRFLVASYGHWCHPLKSHQEACSIQFHVAPPEPPAPAGKDAEILNAVISAERLRTTPQELLKKISTLVEAGGSVARSHAIHAACANNSKPTVDGLLKMDPSIVNSLDQSNATPLMIAALNAAGRSTINGIPETIIIDTLLAAGADKNVRDPKGLTAYGHFRKARKEYNIMMNALMGRSNATSSGKHPTEVAVEQKLLPSGGPTASDISGGEGPEQGFMDYSQEDEEHDAMFGEEESYGDY